jgi:uncharacterized protein
MPQNPRAVVVDTTHSPHARLKPLPINAVRLTDSFWQPRREINRTVTLPAQYQHCEETGRIDNFRRASGKKNVPFQGLFFNDSDVYKWLEAAAWTLATDHDLSLREMVEATITEIADAQHPDGYINTYFSRERAGERYTNLKDMHELYCAGHLLQAAVAHRRATGSDRLLSVACRLADHLCDTFGPEEEGKRPGTCGHEELEMAMVELARETGEEKYLRQAQYFIDARGHGIIGGGAYHQDHKPFREMDRMTGHAVRMVYLTCGAADVYAETGEGALRTALDRLWSNMTDKQMYVSGGIGSRYEGEAFGKDYELPNERAYTETCAAIGSVMWNWRMLQLGGDARYADLMELTLYNAVLPGLSLDGQSYFYQNPLADDGTHRRQPWFGCACCPPNVARLLASLPGYFYSASEEGVWVHLFAESHAQVTLPGGKVVSLLQRTNYPWDGWVSLGINTAGAYSLFIRIPGWCDTAPKVSINGKEIEGQAAPGTYLEIKRVWSTGDVVDLELPMSVRPLEAHPHVMENAGRVALMRGPLLYCFEQTDNLDIDLRDTILVREEDFCAKRRADLLGGVTVLSGSVGVEPPGSRWDGRLYGYYGGQRYASEQRTQVTAVPYYAWANRGAGRMQVWMKAE